MGTIDDPFSGRLAIAGVVRLVAGGSRPRCTGFPMASSVAHIFLFEFAVSCAESVAKAVSAVPRSSACREEVGSPRGSGSPGDLEAVDALQPSRDQRTKA